MEKTDKRLKDSQSQNSGSQNSGSQNSRFQNSPFRNSRSLNKGFTEGPIWLHITRVSGFMTLGFLSMTIGQLVVTVYLGLVGKEELAAIAFNFPLVMALSALTRGIGVGASSLLARTIGSGDRKGAGVLATHCFMLALMFTIFCSILVAGFASEIFSLLGAKGHVHELTVSYTHVWLLGFPATGMALMATGMIRSFGDAAFPGFIMSSSPAIQVLLGPVLIFGWLGLEPMGLEGAAWAAVVGSYFQLLLVIYWFTIRESVVVLTLKNFAHSTREILHIGVPASASNLIQPLSAGVVIWLLAGYGNLVVAGFGVASRIEAVVGMVAIGISTSIVPLVGQNWGARKFDRVDETLRLCYLACLVWGVLAAIIMWIGAEFFISLINDDPSLVHTALLFLYIVPVTSGFMGMINVSTHSFNALRKPFPALILSLLRLIVVYIPLALLGSYFYGYTGVFVATAITNVLIGIAAIVWNRRVVKKEKELILKSL